MPSPVDRIAATLAPVLPEGPTTLVVDRVRLTGSPIGGPLAGHLRDVIAEAVSRAPGITLVDDERTGEILDRLARWLGDHYDQATVPEPGRFSGARFIVEASYIGLADPARVRLSLAVREIETLRAKTASVEMPRADLPSNLALEPSNADRVNFQMARWQEEVPANAFRVDAWTDRGAGASYQPGETLRVYVRSARTGRLRVELMDAAGAVTAIFPNAFHPDDRIEAGRVVEIPDASMGFTLEVSGGAGAELIRAVVTGDDAGRAQGFCGYSLGR